MALTTAARPAARAGWSVQRRRHHVGWGDNLPYDVNAFVGRELELAHLRALFNGTRLLTLLGISGVGKTRLAIRLAAESTGEYPDGIWLLDLTSIVDAALVPQALCDLVGAQRHSGQSWLQELARTLRRRRLLLVLDNCEHLLATCAEVADSLLRACTGVRILATSLQPLGAAGEATWRVPPLRLPPISARRPEELRGSEAIDLFVTRVRAHVANFTLDEWTTPAVVEICQRLDGLPLALELVAARVETLGVTEVAARLGDQLAMAVGTGRAIPARQRTLQAALEWSCGLLEHDERVLLRRLAVFVSGWTLAAAEAVCGDADLQASERVLDTLSGLVSKSLVIADHANGTTRYRLLETVRAYALQELQNAGEREALQERHAEYMLQLAESSSPDTYGSAPVRVLAPEEDNVRTALDWALRHARAELGLRLAAAAFPMWYFAGHYVEGSAWLDRLLDLPGAHKATPARATALAAAGQLHVLLGEYDLAQKRGEAALSEQLANGDSLGVALMQEMLGNVALQRGDLPRADALHTESAERKRQVGSPRVISNLLQLGQVATELDDHERARRLIAEIEGIGRASAEPVWVAGALHLRALAAAYEGNVQSAAKFLEHEVALARAAGSQHAIVKALTVLGHIRLDQGERDDAIAALAEAVELARASGEQIRLVRALEACARCFADRDSDAAVRLAGATDRQRQLIGATPWPSERRCLQLWLARVRRAVGRKTFEEAWQDGHTSTLEQALNMAEALIRGSFDAATAVAPLTPREQEIAALLAHGFTNKHIAAELQLSPGTVRSHVEHILTKLDLRSRAQIAVWAAQQGLLSADR